jgi:hypothetical protein
MGSIVDGRAHALIPNKSAATSKLSTALDLEVSSQIMQHFTFTGQHDMATKRSDHISENRSRGVVIYEV